MSFASKCESDVTRPGPVEMPRGTVVVANPAVAIPCEVFVKIGLERLNSRRRVTYADS
jgi:hypothetical protein